jgi:hypothetical protein
LSKIATLGDVGDVVVVPIEYPATVPWNV